MEGRKVKEFPPICDDSAFLIDRFSKYGLNAEFSWSDVKTFMDLTGNIFNVFELNLLKECSSEIGNSHRYSEVEAEPPYMSDEFREQRQIIIDRLNERKK